MMITLSGLSDSDIVPMARLHCVAFPDFFLSSLGEAFLVQLYRGFVEDRSAVAVVAHDDAGMVRGSAVGTLAPAGFFRRLLVRHWPGFVMSGVRTVLARPSTAPRLLRAVRYRGDTGDDHDSALLSSICVDPGTRGLGIGSRLLAEWVSVARARGARRATLTTDADHNDAVNAFYLANGWQLDGSLVTREGRSMNRYAITLGGVR